MKNNQHYAITFLLTCFVVPIGAQQTINFNYLKDRFGLVDVEYSVLTESGKRQIKTNNGLEIYADEQDQYLVIELKNLRLGYDQPSKLLKKPRDGEHFFLYIPRSPENVSFEGVGFKLISIGNEGRMAAQNSDKVNKSIEIKYAIQNKSVTTNQQSINIKFVVDAYEGKTQIRPSEKGGAVITKSLIVFPNPKIVQQDKAYNVAEKILDTSLTLDERMNYYDMFSEHFAQINPVLTKEINEWKNNLAGNKKDGDWILHDQIKRAYSLGNKRLSFDLCKEYDEKMITQPDLLTGRYLPDILYYGILSAGERDQSQRKEWKTRLEKLFPEYAKSRFIPEFEYSTTKTYVRPERIEVFPGEVDTILIDTMTMDSLDVLDLIIESKETLDFPSITLEDEGAIIIHDNQKEITLQTNNASNIYIVSFVEQKTRALLANPSFKGEEKSMNLQDMNLPNGEYAIQLENKNGVLLASEKLEFRSRKLSAELRYILGLSSILFCIWAYRKFFLL